MRLARSLFLKQLRNHHSIYHLSETRQVPPLELFDIWKEPHLLSRRSFLEKAVKVSLAGVVVGQTIPKKTFASLPMPLDRWYRNDPEIAIIGAGIAGLTCAYTLQNAGYRSTVYESSGRYGGRIQTDFSLISSSVATELGAEFIDHENHEILNLVTSLGLNVYDTYTDTTVSRETYFNSVMERNFTDREVFEQFLLIVKTLQSDYRRIQNEQLARALDRVSLYQYIDRLECEDWFKGILTSAYVAEMGLDSEEQSCLNLISFIGRDPNRPFLIYGESDARYKIKGGNYRICQALSQRLESEVQYQHQLVRVSETSAGSIDLEFSNRKTARAQLVVLTIPYTALRNVQIGLPQMTPERRKCIDQLVYGQTNKLLLRFNGRPWRDQGKAGFLFNDFIQDGWDHSQLQSQNKGLGGYTVYIGGRQAEELRYRSPDTFVKVLNQVYPGAINQWDPTRTFVTNWHENPLSQGSYAAFKVGQWTDPVLDLVDQPIGNVFFAGEHCSHKFQGHMNGAVESGRNAALQIISRLGPIQAKIVR